MARRMLERKKRKAGKRLWGQSPRVCRKNWKQVMSTVSVLCCSCCLCVLCRWSGCFSGSQHVAACRIRQMLRLCPDAACAGSPFYLNSVFLTGVLWSCMDHVGELCKFRGEHLLYSRFNFSLDFMLGSPWRKGPDSRDAFTSINLM